MYDVVVRSVVGPDSSRILMSCRQ